MRGGKNRGPALQNLTHFTIQSLGKDSSAFGSNKCVSMKASVFEEKEVCFSITMLVWMFLAWTGNPRGGKRAAWPQAKRRFRKDGLAGSRSVN